MGPKLSVIALYNWDNTLFQGFQIPSGMDQAAMVDLILTECSNFNVLYPDPTFFKQRLFQWNARRLPIWTKLYITTLFEYDPIANYDRTETTTETVTHTGTDGVISSGSAGHTGTVSDTWSGTDTESKTAYNSSTLATTGQNQNAGTTTSTNNLQDTTSGSSTRTVNLADAVSRSIRAYGNIGVTTTQQMIEQERQIDIYDVYGIILTDFIESFCVQVY